MTTDQLIELLAADLTPVGRRRIMWTMILAVALGTAAAFGAMLLLFNPRIEFPSGRTLGTLLIKIFFASGVVATAAVFLPQLTRPEARMYSLPKLVFIPFATVAVSATVALALSHWSSWAGMIVGRDWTTCRDSGARGLAFRVHYLGPARGGVDRSNARRRNRRSRGRRPCRIGVRLPLCGWGASIDRTLVQLPDRHLCRRGEQARPGPAAVVICLMSASYVLVDEQLLCCATRTGPLAARTPT